VLQGNGIDENYQEEIEELFRMTNIKKIDLSRNFIDCKTINSVSRVLKEEVFHLEWIE
jgi:Ran GTPase-activating protein (RanGAP) involved in mRNA processing and transport